MALNQVEANNLAQIVKQEIPWSKVEVLARDLETDEYFVWVRTKLVDTEFSSFAKWEAYKDYIKRLK